MVGRGWSLVQRQNYDWQWVVVGAGGKIMTGHG